MARHEGLVHGMISRSNYEMTLRDAINGTKASDKEKAAMIEKMLKNSEQQSAKRKQDGGKLDEHDALRAVEECLTKLNGKVDDAEIAKAKAGTTALLGPINPKYSEVWGCHGGCWNCWVVRGAP